MRIKKKSKNHPPPLPQISPAMIPLYLSLGLSCLSFASAVPFQKSAREPLHLPVIAKRGPLSADGYIISAHVLRDKYGYPQSSLLKRGDIPVFAEVCPCSAP